MQNRSIRYSAFLLALLVVLTMCAIDVDAKHRRKRHVRRGGIAKTYRRRRNGKRGMAGVDIGRNRIT